MPGGISACTPAAVAHRGEHALEHRLALDQPRQRDAIRSARRAARNAPAGTEPGATCPVVRSAAVSCCPGSTSRGGGHHGANLTSRRRAAAPVRSRRASAWRRPAPSTTASTSGIHVLTFIASPLPAHDRSAMPSMSAGTVARFTTRVPRSSVNRAGSWHLRAEMPRVELADARAPVTPDRRPGAAAALPDGRPPTRGVTHFGEREGGSERCDESAPDAALAGRGSTRLLCASPRRRAPSWPG